MNGGGEVAVLVMAKAPRPGQVKTRLAPLLGDSGAARLQAELILHTTRLAAGAARTFVAVDPPSGLDEVALLVPQAVELFAQVPGHLGARMDAGVRHVAGRTGGPVIVIGTDAPTLGADRMVEAARRLAGGADAAIGPALDGGYYLIALPRPDLGAFGIAPGLWGGDKVLAATVANLEADGRRVDWLPALRDLDTPADAAALAADTALPPAIRALLHRTVAA